MVFSTIAFLFKFLPIFLIVYYLTPAKYRNLTLIVGSLIFYSIGAGWRVLLLLLSVLINFCISRCFCGKYGQQQSLQKGLFIFGMVYNFGMLVLFKYANFFIDNLNGLFGSSIAETGWVLPLGISFYTFQATSYLIDVYTKKTPPARSIIEFCTYLVMFPQLISGPITTFVEMRPQIRSRKINISKIESGLEVFIIGLAAKTVLADPMSGLWNDITVIGFDSISTSYAWLGAFAYSFEIYFDFAGYSMMAIGVGKMLGFNLPQNFNLPYMSGSASEFWRRWHISLGRWFRNYIYIPLGGNRKGAGRTVFNMLVVWAFTGFWHGANWNFILWGLIFFVLLTLEKNVYGKKLESTKVLKHIYIIVLIPLTWVVFAISDMGQLGTYFSRLFPIFASDDAVRGNARDFLNALNNYWKILVPCVLFSTPLPLKLYNKYRTSIFCKLLMVVLFIYAIHAMVVSANNPFLYFSF